MPERLRRIRSRRLVPALILVAVPLSVGACTDDAPAVKLSAEGTKGKAIAARLSCANCHSANGDELTGPSWKGLYGARITLTGGKKITVDDAYLRRSVREPNAQRRSDATGQMPTFDEDRLTDAELAEVIAYIKDLSA